MATAEEYIALICPTLTTISGYAAYVSLAESLTSASYFGDNYEFAVALRAAHLYTVNTKRSGESGYVTQKTEGRLSKSFGGLGIMKSELMGSTYGMQLLALINATNAGVVVANSDIYNTYLGG